MKASRNDSTINILSTVDRGCNVHLQGGRSWVQPPRAKMLTLCWAIEKQFLQKAATPIGRRLKRQTRIPTAKEGIRDREGESKKGGVPSP